MLYYARESFSHCMFGYHIVILVTAVTFNFMFCKHSNLAWNSQEYQRNLRKTGIFLIDWKGFAHVLGGKSISRFDKGSTYILYVQPIVKYIKKRDTHSLTSVWKSIALQGFFSLFSFRDPISQVFLVLSQQRKLSNVSFQSLFRNMPCPSFVHYINSVHDFFSYNDIF